jgi:hypothetical protein
MKLILFLFLFLQGSKSVVYVSIMGAGTKKPTSAVIQIKRGNEILIDDFETKGTFKIQMEKGTYEMTIIKCDTSKAVLRIINPKHTIGIFVNECENQ